MALRKCAASLGASVLFTIAGLVPSALAADKDLEVDIDSLEAEIRYVGGSWEVTAEYEIEIEDARPHERFELLLQVTEHDHVLRNSEGRPITIVVALDRPSEVDDDEMTFEGEVTFVLPRELISSPKHLRIVGVVVHAGDDRPLDRDDDGIKFKRDRR
jgi:hypothetical protein